MCDHSNFAALVARAPQGQSGNVIVDLVLSFKKRPRGWVYENPSKGWKAEAWSRTVDVQKWNGEDTEVDIHLDHPLPRVLAHYQRKFIDLCISHKT